MEFIIRDDDTNEVLFTLTGSTIANKVFTHLVKSNKDFNLSLHRIKDGVSNIIKEGKNGEYNTVDNNIANAYEMVYTPYVEPIPLAQ